MIVYDLECRAGGHRFEGWFGSSEDFTSQQERGLVTCPHCGSHDVGKAVQAPRLSRKGNQLPVVGQESNPSTAKASFTGGPVPPAVEDMMRKLANAQAEALKTSRFVGDNFSDQARAMHYGEQDQEAIHGNATLQEAKDLLDEGISVAPLPFPVLSPDKAN